MVQEVPRSRRDTNLERDGKRWRKKRGSRVLGVPRSRRQNEKTGGERKAREQKSGKQTGEERKGEGKRR